MGITSPLEMLAAFTIVFVAGVVSAVFCRLYTNWIKGSK
jgi:hypothetical protein